MIRRLDMADALLARAQLHRSKIGDHGDSYEASLLAGEVQLELKIIVKEMFDHLRSCLDYAAREVVEHTSAPSNKPVYFPIVGKTFAAKDFEGRFGQLMPDVAANRPDLVDTFASFQPFSSTNNYWISDFATLCNQSKHENLAVSSREDLRTIIERVEDGVTVIWHEKPDGSSFVRYSLMLLSGWPEDGVGECISHYISLTEIDDELLWFIDQCIAGIGRIIQTIRASL
ncbi:hypothetical protein HF925_01785 [Acidithiobacillus ferriphilus]|uniref:hypothetical protein n=1 Tax=Acidithiobacillus ferriphilus TaxID=1689834 RepID=UPI001C07C788|nr:hypothetical protein [Acidithiobacillus ferriphilus]MBU2847328.1 hypothetical protein [Acidithiobacillus ferriphilus]